MDMQQLRNFVEIADAGGISAAALRLGLSKSIVSRRLTRLEAELGVQLLSRTTRGAALTDSGEAFWQHAARACAEIDDARSAILPARELRGRLRISAPNLFSQTHFEPMLAEMGRRHPRLQIHTSYTDRLVDLVGEGYDCAIRLGYLRDSNLVARRIGTIHGRVVASPGYIEAHGAPETPCDLAGHEALMQGTGAWLVMDGGRSVAIRPQGRFKADNDAALVVAALAGLGVACLPDCLVRDHLASGALVPVMTRYPIVPAGAYVVRPPGMHPAPTIRILTDLLIEYFDAHSAQADAPSCATWP